jgi:hypothetical protein
MSFTLGDIERQLGELFAQRTAEPAGGHALLDRYAAGELLGPERDEVNRHLAGCPSCREEWEAFERVAPVWESAGAGSAGGSWLRVWWTAPRLLAVASAAAVALLLLLVPFGGRDTEEDRLHPKGAWQLMAAGERGGNSFRVVDGTTLQVGDRLGFFYTADKDGFLMVGYVDARGEFVRLYPALQEGGAAARAGKDLRLSDGALIIPGQGCEWILGLFSERPIPEPQARLAVRRMWEHRRGCRLDNDAAGLPGVQIQVIQVNR